MSYPVGLDVYQDMERVKVKAIAIFFAFLGLFLIGCVVAFIMTAKRQGASDSLAQPPSNAISKNMFSNFSYKTCDSNGKEIVLTSDEVLENKKDNYQLKNIASTFTLSNGEKCFISADTTKAINSDRTVCDFVGHVTLRSESGLLLQTERSFVDFNRKTASGDTAISITGRGIDVSGDKYHFDLNKNMIVLTGNAKGVIQIKSSLQKKMIFSDQIVIYLDTKSKKPFKSLEAIKNAKFVSEDYQLTAQEKIVCDNNEMTAISNVELICNKNEQQYTVKSDQMHASFDEQSSIQEVKAKGSLTVKTKSAIIAADSGVFKSNKITVEGSVVVSNEYGDVFGDTAEYDITTGDVSIKKSTAVLNNSKEL
jgi:LPS export ABC transporter protein LptC